MVGAGHVVGLGTRRTRVSVEGSRVPLSALARVVGESGVLRGSLLKARVPSHDCHGERLAGFSGGIGAVRVEIDEAQEDPNARDDKHRPSELAVCAILVQIRCLRVVGDTDEEGKGLQGEEEELSEDSEARARNAEHHNCVRVSRVCAIN